MAFVSDGFHSTVTLKDQGGNASTLSYEFSANVLTLADAVIAQVAMNSLIENVTRSNIVNYSVCERFADDAFILPADAQNEDKASVSFTKSGYGGGNLKIPAPIDAMFQGTSGAPNNQVDLTNAFLVAYTDNFKSGGNYTVSSGESLVQLTRGKRMHARNNNG
jgi:hypothetical protein